MDGAWLRSSPPSASASSLYTVTLEGGPPWGIRLQGGYEFSQKLRIAKVNPNSKAYCEGVQAGDVVESINGLSTDHMSHEDALHLFKNSNEELVLELTRSERQSAIPVIRVESPTGRRKSESDFLQSVRNSQFNKDKMTAKVPSRYPRDLPSAAIWSPTGYSQTKTKTYQPVHFDSAIQNKRERTARNTAAVQELDSVNGQQVPESQTSSLKVKLSATDGQRIKREEETRTGDRDLMIISRENARNKLTDETNIHPFFQNNKILTQDFQDFGTFGSADSILPHGVVTAKLKLIQSEKLPACRSPVLTLLKKNRDEELVNDKMPRAEILQSTDTYHKPIIPVCKSIQRQTLESEKDGSKSDSELSQKDWYKHVFKALHKVDEDPDIAFKIVDEAETTIPPRPKTAEKFDIMDGRRWSGDSLDTRKGEKYASVQKGIVEIPPCGLRYVSKPDRQSTQVSDSNLMKSSSEASASLSSGYQSLPYHKKFHSLDLEQKAVKKQPPISIDITMSPKLLEYTRKKEDDSLLYSDQYWLDLAGLGSPSDRNATSTGRIKSPADRAPEKSPVKALALYSFKANSEKELSFNQGDKMCILRPIDKNWYEVEHNGAVGLIPQNYVKIIDGTENDGANDLGQAVAKHDFTAKFPTELSFNKGDVVTLLRLIDKNWYEGKLGQKTGIFPVSYVELMPASSSSQAIPFAGQESQIPSSPSSSVTANTVISAITSPTSNYRPDVSKDILEFDKLFQSYDETPKKDPVINSYQNGRNIGQSPGRPYAGSTGYGTVTNPQYNNIMRPSGVNDTKMATWNTKHIQEPRQHVFQSEQIYDPFSRTTEARAATPSLHLMYEEPWFQVLYNYSPQHDDELDLQEGDLIYLLERCVDGWCVGQSDRTKRIGTFPSNYVTQLG